MTDFGGKLRQARERRGVSLRQIAASTKISVAALEALERNDISRLPGGIFIRAFIRAYALEVGLDPDETVREFQQQFDAAPAPEAPAPVPFADEESAFESRQRMANVLLKIIVASFVVAAVIMFLAWRQAGGRRGQTVEPPPAAGERVPTRGASLQVPWILDSVRL